MINNTHGAAFFAAMNTPNGFVSYFREIFDKVDTVYVIKGGSGTGKSRFMREVADVAVKKGLKLENFLCSSDPASLDGIIIQPLGVAILDGTAPHIHEPTLIGAREHFIDLSAFLDGEMLKTKKDEIQAYQAAKSKRYAGIYQYLKIIDIYNGLIKRAALPAFNEAKMDKAVKKSTTLLKKSAKYEKQVRLRSAISCDGHIVLNTYAKMASKRFALSDICLLGGLYLKKLLALTDAAGISVTVSYDPLDPSVPDALYYPDSDISFYVGGEKDYEETKINMLRFVADEKLRPYKPEIRALTRLKNSAISQMNYDFSAIKRLHIAIEEIYSQAMCFEGKERMTRSFIETIL